MIKKIITEIFKTTLEQLISEGHLPASISPKDVPFSIELPKNHAYGDFACNIAMVLAKLKKKSPRALAEMLIDNLVNPKNSIEKLEIAGPGFINLVVSSSMLSPVIPEVLKLKNKYGHAAKKLNKKVLIEFVSANPTGPLHLGHARGAFLGDATAKILSAAGFDVVKEFYVNDMGNQIATLGRSVYARYRELFGEKIELKKGEYPGAYVIEIAKVLHEEDGDKWLNLNEKEWLPRCIEVGVRENLAGIQKHLGLAGISMDSWFSEKTLHHEKKLEALIEDYHKHNMLYRSHQAKGTEDKIRRENCNAAKYTDQQAGGLFLKTSKFGDEEDRVIVKEDGLPVYLAADLTYHRDKFYRQFDRLIDVFGADHAGHIPRIRAGMRALDIDDSSLEFIVVQIVRLLRAGKEVKISKRSGEMYLLADLIEEIGIDSTRFIFLMRAANTKFDFDIDLTLKQSNDNPVFYVQYGYARMANLLKKAKDTGVPFEADSLKPEILEKLTLKVERNMLIKIADFENCIMKAAYSLEPHKILYYCQELIAEFHSYFTKYKYSAKVISDDVELSQARLALVAALKQTLYNGLSLLGVSALDYMNTSIEESS